MTLDQRSNAILSYLAEKAGYVPMTEITEKFNISRRTVYYDIEKINNWLKDNHLPEVSHVKTAGFHLEKEAAAQLPEKLNMIKSWHYEYSAKERRAWLAVYLLVRNTPFYLENLMEKVRVSRNTTINDLKGLKRDLERFNLALGFDRKAGYLINGKEDDKREAIVFFLHQVLPQQGWKSLLSKLPNLLNGTNDQFDFFVLEKMPAVEEIVSESEKELNVQFTDEFLHNLSFRLLLFARRLSQGKNVHVNLIEKRVLSGTKEYKVAQKLAGKLSFLFGQDFPEDEIFYITKHLLSSRVQFSESLLDFDSSQDAKVLKEIVSKMVTDFQKLACIVFENREEIENNLFLHVKPAYYRLLYGLEVENNMVDSIKEKYPDIFQITKKVCRHLEIATGKQVNDMESALIAVHFGGWMEKIGAKPADRKRALLVCTTGVGTSRLLQSQLEGLFSTVDIIGCVSLREYEKNQNDADFIISTIPLTERDKPVFVVNSILTETEKEILLKKVNSLLEVEPKKQNSIETVMDIIRSYADIKDEESLRQEIKEYYYQTPALAKKLAKPDLIDLLKPSHIRSLPDAPDWKEAIQLASRPLLENSFISEEYVQAMVENLVKMGPYVVVSPKVAIPHARPEDGVKKLGMSLLQLKKSVSFSSKEEHEVSLVIVLAAIDGETHLKALGQVIKIMSSPEIKAKLLSAATPENIYELIRSYAI